MGKTKNKFHCTFEVQKKAIRKSYAQKSDKRKQGFPNKFPFWARLKINKNRTTLVIDEAPALNNKTKKVEDGFVHREAIHTENKDYEKIEPKRHKDGALHFHALMSDINLTLVPAVGKDGKSIIDYFGNIIFNVKDWDFGFSTCAVIPKDNNNLRVANYLVKYITKDGNIDYNAKRYYHTQNLNFKNKTIAYLTEEEFAKSEFKEGIEKVKSNERMDVYYYSAPKDTNLKNNVVKE